MLIPEQYVLTLKQWLHTTAQHEGRSHAITLLENAQIKKNMKSIGRDFKIMPLNIFTLMKLLDELRVLVDHQKPDILAINETKNR